MDRSSGILMAMSSLPSDYGIGTMGKCARQFVDFLKAAGQKYWQLLPLGPTSYGDSPYQSFSTFAGNPYYIDLDQLVKDGLLKKKELEGDWGGDAGRVDYGRLYERRYPVLRLAYERGREALYPAMDVFRRENPWVEDYALFMAVKRHFGMRCWTDWPDEGIRLHRPEAVREYGEKLKDEVGFLANSLNTRHNNLEGKNAKPALEDMPESELERWYDYLAGLFAEAILAEKRVDMRSESKELRERLRR